MKATIIKVLAVEPDWKGQFSGSPIFRPLLLEHAFVVCSFTMIKPQMSVLVYLRCCNKNTIDRIAETAVYFLTILEAGGPRLRCQEGWSLVIPLFLAWRQVPSHCVFTGLSSVHTHPWCSFFSFLYGHTSYWIRAPSLGPHLTLITSFKDSFSIQSLWRLRLQHRKWAGWVGKCSAVQNTVLATLAPNSQHETEVGS